MWVQEQNEEKSMNLTKFTEHFNNMSFWCRTLILEQADAKVIVKHVTQVHRTLTLIAGERTIPTQIHKNHEMVKKDEQF